MGILFCFVPLIFIIVLLTLGFKIKLSYQLIACFLGLIVILPISFIQFLIPTVQKINFSPVVYALLKSIFIYGFIEELLKMIAIYPLPHKNCSLRDFLMLSFVLGLSLGCFESVVYYFDHLQIANNKGAQLLYGRIAIRIFTSDIIHMTCTGLSGLFIYTTRVKNFKPKISYIFLAILIHGIYDFFAGFSNNLKWFSAFVVIYSIIECQIKYCSLQKND